MRTLIHALIALAITASPAFAQRSTLDILETLDGVVRELRTVLVPPPVVIQVPAGGNLQAAIDTMPPGATLVLAAGATFRGAVLKGGPGVIISAGFDVPTDMRVTPLLAANFAKIVSPGGGVSALSQAPGAHGWRIVGVELWCACNDVVQNGLGTETTLDALPLDTVYQQVYVHGDPVLGAKRGISLNSRNVTVRDSHVSDIKRAGQDTQAVMGYNGPGPYVILNNHLEASGENVMFGGADPTIPGLVPSDILIKGNTISKPRAWQLLGWTEKNLLELKNARRVEVVGNVLENSWRDGQVGYAVLLTVRNQDGKCPQCTIEDVEVHRNTIRNADHGVQILGTDYTFPSARMKRVSFHDNTWENISGRMISINGSPEDLEFRNETFGAGSWVNSFLTFDGALLPSTLRFRFVDNRVPEGEYGITGTGLTIGVVALTAYAPAFTWSGNIVKRGPSGRFIAYPPGTSVVP
jgi:hypothetical protein